MHKESVPRDLTNKVWSYIKKHKSSDGCYVTVFATKYCMWRCLTFCTVYNTGMVCKSSTSCVYASYFSSSTVVEALKSHVFICFIQFQKHKLKVHKTLHTKTIICKLTFTVFFNTAAYTKTHPNHPYQVWYITATTSASACFTTVDAVLYNHCVTLKDVYSKQALSLQIICAALLLCIATRLF